ncbi:ribonuclease H-like domain-containing protein [Tanacetum coccineum]
MAGSDDEIIPPPPPPQTQTPTQQGPHIVSTIKLPILKKGEYDILAMKMEHYLAHTDYPIWEVIQIGNGPVSVSTDTNGVIKKIILLNFTKMTDAKEMWEAIKSRFGGNDESKNMQKYILKQQFEGFSVSNLEGLHKGYDRFQSLLSQLEIHGVDSLSFDDLYNNLRVFKPDVKGSTASSSSTQNVAFVSENTSNTNEDLEQLDEFDLEEMDLKWQVAMISMRLKKFYKKTGRKLQFDAKEPVGFDKSKFECYNCHKIGNFARECRSKGNQDSRRRDAGYTGYKAKNSSDTEVTSCSKECKESYTKLKKLYDEQREQLGDASIEIQAYTQALKKVEAQLVAHQQNQLWYEENIRFMKIDLDDKTDVLTYHKKLLAETKKEKEELKAKVEKWHNSSKNLNILLTSQMSARDKVGLGYRNQMNKGVLSYENEVFESVFYSRFSDIEDSPVNDRYVEGMHAVPPLMIGIYIPSGLDVEIDESHFTYGPKQSKPSESDARSSDFNSCESNSSKETLTSMPEPVVNEPKVVSQPKVWSDAPIIEEYKSDSDDEHDVPHKALENKGIVDSGCSRHMTGNKAYLAKYQDYNGGLVAFGDSKGYITGKDTEFLMLSPDFKLPNENQVLLRVPRQNNMYSFNLESIVPSGGLACLIAKDTVDESNKWHRRLGYVNFKNLNKLVKGNLLRGLPSKIFQNDHTCVACQKVLAQVTDKNKSS